MGFGTDDGKTCHECKLDNCIEYDDSCQCQKCIDGFGAVTDPKTKIEVCVHCSLTNCKMGKIKFALDAELKIVRHVQLVDYHVMFALINIISNYAGKCQPSNCG